MNHSTTSTLRALILPVIFLLGCAVPALAGSIAAGYAGDGIWPVEASANSKRWYRAIVTTATNEIVWSLSMRGVTIIRNGTYVLPTQDERTDAGIAVSSVSSGVTAYTIGPYAGYDIFGSPHQGTVGTMSTGGQYLDPGYTYTTFTVSFRTGTGEPTTPVSVNTANYRTWYDNSDYLQWFSGDATGIDPLAVTPSSMTTPDDGTGSSTYKFRVRYVNRANLRPRFYREGERQPESSGRYLSYVDYDPWSDEFFLRWDTDNDYWMYTYYDDPGLDRIGWDRSWGSSTDLHRIAVIIDDDTTRPRFMHREDTSDSEYRDGVIFFYELLPTDYKRFIDNILLFPYDPAGEDDLDRYVTHLRGRPNSNNYVALAAGGHKYEFLATDDIAPAMDATWLQVGRPGNGLYNDYYQTTPYYLNRGYLGRSNSDHLTGSVRTRRFTRFLDNDYAAGGSGYAYDSQDPTRYPKSDPVLTAHPYFPNGSVPPNATFNPNPVDPRGLEVFNSPFTTDVGGGPTPPLRYTNDDTVLPNWANIYPEDTSGYGDPNAAPFRGGKWTNQTKFTLRINYWQSDNVPPQYIRVYIRRNDAGGAPGSWMPYTMEQVNPSETSYNDGCVFQFQTTPEQLPGGGGPGDYNYYFQANDGVRPTIFPNRPADYQQPGAGTMRDLGQYGVPYSSEGEDYFWFRVNRPPTLASQSVTPAAGRAGENYRFQVRYTDADGEVLNAAAAGDRPFQARLNIDLFGVPLGKTEVRGLNALNVLQYDTIPWGDTAYSGVYYEDGSLVDAAVPFTITMLTGAAAGNTYQIAANVGNLITLAGANLAGDGVAIGDEFRIEKWFASTMDPLDPTNTAYNAGVDYIFDTASNVELGEGTHRYYFQFCDDWGSWVFPDDANTKVEGEYVRFPASGFFQGPEVRGNTPPELRDFRFTPQAATAGAFDGNTATDFTFYVTYVDNENDPPALIRLGIDGTPQSPARILDMVPDPATDTVYTDGATYRSQPVQLSEGTHVFYAQASDGRARFPVTAPGDPLIFSGPVVPAGHTPPPPDANVDGYLDWVQGPNVAPNTPPTLSFLPDDDEAADPVSPGLTPNVGNQSTAFTFTIKYTDVDRFADIAGNPPDYVRVYVDDIPYDMSKHPDYASDNDYTDGVVYQYTISGLVEGTPHTYFFIASDGLDQARKPIISAVPNRYNGPVVDEPPSAPLNLLAQDTPNDNGGSVNLQFSPSPDDGGGARDVSHYRVYRTTIQGQYSGDPVLIVPATEAAAYMVQDAAPDSADPPINGVTYYYIVRAAQGTVDDPIESARSNESTPVIPLDNIHPQPPTSVDIIPLTLGGTLDITWNLSVDDPTVVGGNEDVQQYRVYRSLNADMSNPVLAGSAGPGETTYRDEGVLDSVNYYYVVRSWDGSNESVNSNIAGPAQSTDGAPPVIDNLSPADGTLGVRRGATVGFTVTDTGAGVDLSTIAVAVTAGGSPVAGAVATTGTPAQYDVVFTPDEQFDYLQNVRATANASDLGGNAAATKQWSFIIEGEPTSQVSGSVKEADGTPVAGVTVRAGELQGITGANGNYVIAGLADGVHQITCQLQNWYFDPPAVAVTVPPDQPNIDFTAQPGFDITGRVVDAAGQGKAGVLVTAADRSAYTDANGDYAILDLPAGTYRVVPVLDGFDFVEPYEDVVLGPDAANVNFTAVVETHALSGSVQTTGGERLQGVALRATNVNTNAQVEVVTGVSGQYVFQALEAGVYDITPTIATHQFLPAVRRIELAAQATEVNFVAVPLYTVSLPAGLSMVALPIEPQTTDFRAAFGANTPVARWDEAAQAWVTSATPADPVLALAAGRGYFVNAAAAINNNVAGTPIPTNVGFDIAVDTGWTMVGNPYPANLPWARLGVASGGVVRDYGFIWDRAVGDYRIVADVAGLGILDTVPNGAGFWMRSDAPRVIRINAPALAAAETSSNFALGAGDWVLPIRAEVAGRVDQCAALGVVKNAGQLPGGGKMLNPPSTGGSVDLYFVDDGKELAYDVRSAAAGSDAWRFEVISQVAGQPVTIAMPDLSSLPADKQVTLVDTAANRRIYVRTTQAYTYDAEAGVPRAFEIIVAPRSVAALTITSASANVSNGGQVALTYALSQDAAVTVEVMNISGRPIKMVTAGKAAAAGVNTELWDLRSSAGTKVPAGRYLVTVTAATDSGQQARAVIPVQVNR